METNDFAGRLRSLMATPRKNGKGYTSYYIARHIEGITSSCIEKYLKGTSSPGVDNVKRLADFFHVSPGWLMWGENSNAVFSDKDIVVPANEMWETLKVSVYNQKAQNDHISKLLEILQEKLAKDKK